MNGLINISAVKYFKRRLINKTLEPYRVLTGSSRLMPSFIIIGGMKCGSSSLYRYIIQHHNVKPALTKELYFFHKYKNFEKGIPWYKSHFPFSQQGLITGEATPDYIFHPHAPKRIADNIPSVKLIALLRNPVDRAYSHYYHALRYKWENPSTSFEEAIDKEKLILESELEKIIKDEDYDSENYLRYSYLSRGIYLQQIKRWRQFFLPEQILIIESERLYSEPSKTFRQVLDFLDLPQQELTDYKKYNSYSEYSTSNYPKINPDTRKYLLAYFRPHNESLYEYLGMKFNWSK